MSSKKSKKEKKEVLGDIDQLFELVEIRSQDISQQLVKVSETITLLKSHLNSLSNMVTNSSYESSYSNTLKASTAYQTLVSDSLKNIGGIFEKLSQDLKYNLSLDDITCSDDPEISKIHQNKKSNICRYAAISSFALRIDKYFPTIGKGGQFDAVAKKVMKEFREDTEASVSYRTKTLRQILDDEKTPPTRLPVGIERIMTTIANSEGDKTTLFRLSSDTERINNYFDEIRIVDTKTLDNTVLSSILKKFIRDLPQPIWPEEFLQPLVKVMESEDKNKVINDIRRLIIKFPIENQIFIRRLLLLCKNVTNTKDTKMNSQAIAVCLAPGLMRKADMGFTSIAVIAPVLNNALSTMIDYQEEIFEIESLKTIEVLSEQEIYGIYPALFDGVCYSDSQDGPALNVDPKFLRTFKRQRKSSLASMQPSNPLV
ncbi:hypothetical protein EIN_150960 [Entamoeba invadens IP1]|uniref:Rho-GAP domain-containing protein n=1 Tax=Entamoeba invadens IP1 TaxID=370355 RepID=A0A0A1U8I2_ENTIV|nr:hypothetical protein EIN_150960 [Entamoeba invadens IP1]ELP91219.1 hypothetical protein EIN_150960 [Entamoeba invadens IP1]|eukprot:XP_004257990.1 hypothetical protein EIN_150960 [Entamoeba invadens IP1]